MQDRRWLCGPGLPQSIAVSTKPSHAGLQRRMASDRHARCRTAFVGRLRVLPWLFSRQGQSNEAGNTFSPTHSGAPTRSSSDCVCNACNQSFKKVEQWLARDSVEGVFRYRWRELTPDKGTTFRRLEMSVPYDPELGILQGAVVYPSLSQLGAITFPVQLGLKFTSQLRQYFTWSMLVGESNWHREKREKARALRNDEVFVHGDWHCEEEKYYALQQHVVLGDGCPPSGPEVMSKLSLLGVMHLMRPIRAESGMPEPFNDRGSVKVAMRGRIDSDIQRAIAKIAFNYAVWKRGPHRMLSREFDAVRQYIIGKRDGAFVRPVGEAYVHDGIPLSGHVFRLASSDEGLRVGVTLNGLQEYEVTLGDSGQLCFEHGDFFNLESSQMLEMHRSLLPIYESSSLLLRLRPRP